MGSQSHKRGCLYATNLDRSVWGFGATCGHVSKYYKALDLGKIYCKTSFLFSEFVALRIV